MNDNYIFLLYKQLDGSISKEEQAQLNEWRGASIANEKEASSVELAWNQAVSPSSITVDLDKEFDKLAARIKADTNSSSSTPVRSLGIWRIAAAIAFLVVSAVVLYTTLSPSPAVIQVAQTTDSIQTIELADKSVITLNKNSRLTYPSTFDGDLRQLKLSGEAFFDVAHNPSQAFVVDLGDEQVKVLGTSFNIRTQTNGSTQVYVASGKVEFSNTTNNKNIILKKGDFAFYDEAQAIFIKEENTSANALAWKTQTLFFSELTLADAVKQIEQTFGITFEIEDVQLKSCLLDTSFDYNKVDLFIEDISTIFGSDIEKISTTKYLIKGGRC